jgi:3-hydroxyisobutyrate dehydrogenase-like beta-hydroxyacid dehydrogenase
VAQSVVNEILATGKRDLWIVDTTTGSPDVTAALAESLAASGIRYLDLTIAGSSRELSAGDVVAMLGGDSEDLATLQPVLDSFARKSFALGKAGDASRMKLVTNLALGLHRAVLAETFSFAESQGFPASLALELLKETSSYSRVMDIKGEKMVHREFSPDARLRQHLKDVLLMKEEATRAGIQIPLTNLHAQLLTQAVELGLGDLDNSAILEVFQPRKH